MTFYEKIAQAWAKNNSLVCVGLDPDFNKLPECVKGEKYPLFAFNKAIIDANKYVYNKSKTNPEYEGMGTTISVALIVKNKVYIGHVGDSRIYRIRKHIMRQLTRDHSYVQELYRNGSITKEEA